MSKRRKKPILKYDLNVLENKIKKKWLFVEIYGAVELGEEKIDR